MTDDTLLQTMYDDTTDVTVKPLDSSPGTRRIRVGIIDYEVPTVEYVRQLEHLLSQQTQMLHQQQRALQRLEALLHGARHVVRRQGDAIGDLRFGLTRKVDQA